MAAKMVRHIFIAARPLAKLTCRDRRHSGN
jgi:hypothetical protein